MTISLLLVLAACSQDAIPTAVTGPEQNQLVARVQVQPTEAVLPPDEVLQLSAIVKGARGQPVNGRPVSWSSSDESVAYVDAAGNIVAGNEGTAVITANVLGVKGQATIDVRGQVIDIIMDDPVSSIAEGDVERLTATYVYSNGAKRPAGHLRWTTSDARILWVDGDGEATARDSGDVTIQIQGRGRVGSGNLRVYRSQIKSITVHAGATQLSVGDRTEVWAIIINNKDRRISKKVAWTSSDPTVASVDSDGQVRARAVGATTITARALNGSNVSDVSGSIDIAVVGAGSPPPAPAPGRVTDLSVVGAQETRLSLRFTEVDGGTGAPASYQIRYAEDTESFDWNSALDVNKGSCATPVSGSGAGATLNCSVDGLQASTSYVFQVVAFRPDAGSPVYGPLSNQATGRTNDPGVIVDVIPSSFQIDVGAQKQLTATVKDTYGNDLNQSVSWSSNSSSVAAVDASGLVSGVSAGNAMVRASAPTTFDTSTGTVAQPSSGGGGGGGGQLPPPPSNWVIPSDAIKVTERGFNFNGEDSWGTNSGGANRYVSDSSAPIDAPTVLEMPFGPCTNCGSNGMGNKIVKNWVNAGLPPGRELWIETWVKWSANWVNNPSQTNKIMYPTVQNKANHPTYIGARGVNTSPGAPLYLVIALGGQDNTQCGHNRSHRIHGNRPEAIIPRGQWVNLKLYLRTNDHGACNAVAQAWVNNVQVINTSGFIFVDPGVSNMWWAINYDPVWGGGTGNLPAEQTMHTAYLRAMVK